LDTSVFGVDIVEGFSNTIVVIDVVSSVLHELDIFVSSETSRTGLGSIWHNGHLLIRVLISDSNSGSNWIEVGGSVIGLTHLVVFSLPELLLVHVESV